MAVAFRTRLAAASLSVKVSSNRRARSASSSGSKYLIASSGKYAATESQPGRYDWPLKRQIFEHLVRVDEYRVCVAPHRHDRDIGCKNFCDHRLKGYKAEICNSGFNVQILREGQYCRKMISFAHEAELDPRNIGRQSRDRPHYEIKPISLFDRTVA